MFTLTSLLQTIVGIGFLTSGVRIGVERFGWVGGLAGGFLGLIGGIVVGGTPWAIYWGRRHLLIKLITTEKLRAELHGEYLPDDLCIAELVARGEPLEHVWASIFEGLRSDSSEQRYPASKLQTTWFPRLDRALEGYSAYDSTEECRQSLLRIESIETPGRFFAISLPGWFGGFYFREYIGVVFFGGIPRIMYWGWFYWRQKHMSTRKLIAKLENRHRLADFFLWEITNRGEPAECAWPSILSLLRSNSAAIRRCGWRCLNVWFPRMAIQMPNYNPGAPADVCKGELLVIEKAKPDATLLPLKKEN